MKINSILILIGIVLSAFSSQAILVVWDDGGNPDNSWSNAANWSGGGGGVAPVDGDRIQINNGYTAQLNSAAGSMSGLIMGYNDTSGGTLNVVSGGSLTTTYLYFGYTSGANGTVDVNGGTLTITAASGTRTYGTGHILRVGNGGTISITDSLNLGDRVGSGSLLEVYSGTLDVGADLWLGYAADGGTHNMNMSNGAVNVTGSFNIANKNGVTSTFDFDGGTVTCGSFSIDAGTGVGLMDMSGDATLIVSGDVVSSLQAEINDGSITFSESEGAYSLNFDGDSTVLTAVPEPTSVSLFIVSSGILWIFRQRVKR